MPLIEPVAETVAACEEVLLDIRDVNLSFGGVAALRDVSIAVEQGRVISVIGPNGAGKTTLFNVLSGFLRPDSGEIRFRGSELTKMAPHRISRAGIGRLFQDARVFRQLTVLENVLVGAQFQPGENPLRAFFSRRRSREAESETRARAHELLRLVGLEGASHLWGEQLSHGQQRLLAIARLLAGEPSVLLLDEPTAGVNPVLIRTIIELIREFSDRGITTLIIEHNLSFVMELSDWVHLMDGGEVVAFGTAQELLAGKALREAYLGI